MKDGAGGGLNAGHFDLEIDVDGLEAMAENKEEVRPLFHEYTTNGRSLFLCGEGRLVNLACAEGPSVHGDVAVVLRPGPRG